VSYSRPVNAEATETARQRQAEGEAHLQGVFHLPYDVIRCRRLGLGMHHSLTGLVLDCAPWRTNPNCPRPRTKLEKRRHLARKRARASRRCNR